MAERHAKCQLLLLRNLIFFFFSLLSSPWVGTLSIIIIELQVRDASIFVDFGKLSVELPGNAF